MTEIEKDRIAQACAEMFKKATIRRFKLEVISLQERRYKEYYANGEMSKEDYEAKMQELQDKRKQITL